MVTVYFSRFSIHKITQPGICYWVPLSHLDPSNSGTTPFCLITTVNRNNSPTHQTKPA